VTTVEADAPLVYEPRGACRDLFLCRDTEVLIAGPAGTGKSTAALWRLHSAAMRVPGVRFLLVRKTLKSLAATTQATFREKVLPGFLVDGPDPRGPGTVAYFGGSMSEPPAYRYANGSRIVIGGMDNPTKIMSGEYDIVFVDEATELTVDDWEHLTTRLRHNVLPWQQVIGACNPGGPTHWLRKRADAGALTLLESRHEDNPTLFDADGTMTPEGERYVLGVLDKLTGVRFLRLRRGIWAAAEGVIYEDWDPAVHMVDPFEIPWDWTRWWTVDFGHTNPMVVQCWAEDGDGRLYLYREFYKAKTLVEDMAADVLAIVTDSRAPGGRWREPRPRAIICDHDAGARATLEKHLGLRTSPANKTVVAGIEAVQARLRPAGDGRPRLFVFADALIERDAERDETERPCGFLEEVGGYVWLPPAPGREPKEEPMKVDDHAMDAGRYMVAELDLGDRPQIHVFR
jgi:phage terminase large subunit